MKAHEDEEREPCPAVHSKINLNPYTLTSISLHREMSGLGVRAAISSIVALVEFSQKVKPTCNAHEEGS